MSSYSSNDERPLVFAIAALGPVEYSVPVRSSFILIIKGVDCQVFDLFNVSPKHNGKKLTAGKPP